MLVQCQHVSERQGSQNSRFVTLTVQRLKAKVTATFKKVIGKKEIYRYSSMRVTVHESSCAAPVLTGTDLQQHIRISRFIL